MIKKFTLDFHPSFLKTNTKEGFLIQKENIGEIAPLPGYSKESLEDAYQDLHSQKEIQNCCPSVQFALESASLKIPIDTKIPIASLLWGSKEEIIEKAKNSANTCKIKLSQLSIDNAIALMKILKKSYPDKIFRLDVNRGWNLSQALFFARHFEPTDFAYLEEPLEFFEDLFTFSQETHFPIAVDESIYDIDISEILKLASLKAIVIKPTLFGGISAIQNLQRKIPPHIEIVLSSLFESGVGILNIGALAAVLSLKSAIGIDTYRFIKKDVLQTPLHLNNGFLQLCKICLKDPLKNFQPI